ncbi:MAG: hypothetical protein IKT72_00120 [Clostridia bacterium]|nr:hypothetical protein [Clostridia bacterium]
MSNIINTYRIYKAINPSEVLCAIEELLKKYKISYRNCLWNISCSIIEYEFEGKIHSNRNKNAILSICKRHPIFNSYREDEKSDHGEGHISEDVCLRNYNENTFDISGTVEYPLISDIVKKVPRPYAVNDLKLIFSDIVWSKDTPLMRMEAVDFGCPKGSYIYYTREKYGDEKHSYIHFAADERDADIMKTFAFDFYQSVKCKYEGTEMK